MSFVTVQVVDDRVRWMKHGVKPVTGKYSQSGMERAEGRMDGGERESVLIIWSYVHSGVQM